mmetsp:Transcript_60714/g.112640  ORF Transcript_60714/g.112640 Transcript_60714/m.112640 type:complete len:462 (-) Transcript_60714:65-1450(-)
MTGELREAMPNNFIPYGDDLSKVIGLHSPAQSGGGLVQRTEEPKVEQIGKVASASQAFSATELSHWREKPGEVGAWVAGTCPRQVRRKHCHGAAGIASKTSQQKAPPQRQSKRLLRSLETLSALLKDLPREVRRERLLALDQVTRKALQAFMEARANNTLLQKPAAAKAAQAKVRSACCQAHVDVWQNEPAKGTEAATSMPLYACMEACCPSGALGSISESGHDGCPGRREYTHLQKNSNGLYRAKTTVRGVTIYGTYVEWSHAMEQRVELMKIRDRVLQTACRLEDKALAERDEAAAPVQAASMEGFKAHVTMCAWDWLGKRQVTSPIVGLEEALCLRTKLWQAKAAGWAAFRALWLQLLLDPRHPPRNRRSLHNAEAYVDDVIRCRHEVAKQRRAPRSSPSGQGAKQRRQMNGNPSAKQVVRLLQPARQLKKMEALRARLDRVTCRVQTALAARHARSL